MTVNMSSPISNVIKYRSLFGSETYEDPIASLFLKTKLLLREDEGLSQPSTSLYSSLPISNFHLRPNSPYDISFLQVSYQQGSPCLMHNLLFLLCIQSLILLFTQQKVTKNFICAQKGTKCQGPKR